MKRGVCSVCGKIFSVTTRGVMRCHLGTEREPFGRRWRKNCAGEGKPPARLIDVFRAVTS